MSCEAIGRIRIGSLETPEAVEEAIESLVRASSDVIEDDEGGTCSEAQAQHFEESVDTVAAAIRRLPSDQIHPRIGLPLESVYVRPGEAALRTILVERAIQPPRRDPAGRDLNAGSVMTNDLCVAAQFFRADPDLYVRHLTGRNILFEHRNEVSGFAIRLHFVGSQSTDAELAGIIGEAGRSWLLSQLRYSLDGIQNRRFDNMPVQLFMESLARAAEATDSLVFQAIGQDRERAWRLSLQAASTPAPDVIQEASSVLMESGLPRRQDYSQRLTELNGMSQEQLIGAATEQILANQQRLAQWQRQLTTNPDIPYPFTPEQLLETTLFYIAFAAGGIDSRVVFRNVLTQLTGHEPNQQDLESILSLSTAAMTSTPWDDLMAAQTGELEVLCREGNVGPAPEENRRLQRRTTSEAVPQPGNVTEADISRWLETDNLTALESVARDPNRTPGLRLSAIQALGVIGVGQNAAVSILESLAQDSRLDDRYRVEAAVSVSTIMGQATATPVIVSFLRDSRYRESDRRRVVENIGDVELLASLSRDRRLPIVLRRDAIWWLSSFDDDEQALQIVESLAQDPNLPRNLRSFARRCLDGE